MRWPFGRRNNTAPDNSDIDAAEPKSSADYKARYYSKYFDDLNADGIQYGRSIVEEITDKLRKNGNEGEFICFSEDGDPSKTMLDPTFASELGKLSLEDQDVVKRMLNTVGKMGAWSS